MSRRRRHYPHPYARMGCLGPSVGCAGCLIWCVLALALLAGGLVALAAA